MQEKVYKKWIKDIDELRASTYPGSVGSAHYWCSNQDSGSHVFVTRACIEAKGGHYEHTLSQ